LYAGQRVAVEYFRDTSDPVALHMNPFQWYMAGAVVAGVAWYVLVRFLARPVDHAGIAADVAKMEAALAAQAEKAAKKTGGQDAARHAHAPRSRRRQR
jgi:hypothetical protein